MKIVAMSLMIVVCVFTFAERVFAVPAAPENFRGTVSGNAVTLTWDAASGASGYRLEVGSRSGMADVARLELGQTTSFGTGNVPAGRYYVRLLARDGSGLSIYSNEVVLMVGGGCAVPPSSPFLLGAGISAAGLVNLTWVAGNGCAATSYTLLAGDGPGLSNIARVTLGDTFLNTSAPAGTYYVRVVANNAFGTSAPSREVVATVAGETRSAAWLDPNSVFRFGRGNEGDYNVTAPTTVSATLSWNNPQVDLTYFVTAAGCPGPSFLTCPRVAISSRTNATERRISWTAQPGSYVFWVYNPSSTGAAYVNIRFP